MPCVDLIRAGAEGQEVNKILNTHKLILPLRQHFHLILFHGPRIMDVFAQHLLQHKLLIVNAIKHL